MDAASVFLGRELVKRIQDRREEYLRPLIAGQAADYPEYRARASYLRALDEVEQWIADVRLDEEERRRGASGAYQAGPRPAA